MKNQLINYGAFAILTLLWLAFGLALLFNQDMLAAAWHLLRSWPVLVQLALALLTLPVTLGLWIWQMAWPIWLRLILVLGLAFVTIYTFFPKKDTAQKSLPQIQ